MEDLIKCPKCGSSQVHADKKGFSLAKAAVGAFLTGGVGLLAGTIGSNKIVITCLACGNKFKPGESKPNSTAPVEANTAKILPLTYKSVEQVAADLITSSSKRKIEDEAEREAKQLANKKRLDELRQKHRK